MYVIIDDEQDKGYFQIIDKERLRNSDLLIVPFGFPTITQAFKWLNSNYLIC
ncbi:MAG: hypothetical protein QM445_02520 [Thermotogota bacterium]|nr:hypothetical protein [Thermotogota bacterium]